MESIILSVFGIMALAIIALQVRRGVKSLISNDESKCCSCGGCSESCCDHREDNGEV